MKALGGPEDKVNAENMLGAGTIADGEVGEQVCFMTATNTDNRITIQFFLNPFFQKLNKFRCSSLLRRTAPALIKKNSSDQLQMFMYIFDNIFIFNYLFYPQSPFQCDSIDCANSITIIVCFLSKLDFPKNYPNLPAEFCLHLCHVLPSVESSIHRHFDSHRAISHGFIEQRQSGRRSGREAKRGDGVCKNEMF